ncbi:F0F1 ATP synthase subunit B [Candidatus Azambacteria bacterium]|nr:F0F1 ATP synthase subunit B [Candidatus Azambacteria bacterium]
MEEVLKVFGVNWHLVLIQSVNFGLLLIILHRFLYKPVMRMIDERARKIEKGVRDAAEAERRLQNAEDERRMLVSVATKEADEIINASRKNADDIKASILKEAGERSDKIVADAIKQAEEEKKKAIEKSKSDIAKIAVLTAENILREKLK